MQLNARPRTESIDFLHLTWERIPTEESVGRGKRGSSLEGDRCGKVRTEAVAYGRAGGNLDYVALVGNFGPLLRHSSGGDPVPRTESIDFLYLTWEGIPTEESVGRPKRTAVWKVIGALKFEPKP